MQSMSDGGGGMGGKQHLENCFMAFNYCKKLKLYKL